MCGKNELKLKSVLTEEKLKLAGGEEVKLTPKERLNRKDNL